MQRTISDWGGNVAALAIVIVVNWLANALPLFGTTTGAVSDKYYSSFTPTGFTFGIWGLIYLLLIVFIVYQALPSQRQNETLARIGPWFKANCAFNALWIVTWHLEWLAVTLLLMIGLLVTLVAIYRIVAEEPWYRQLPFSIYTAWIAVALIANISAVQTAFGWNGALVPETTWTLIKLSVAGAVAAIVGLHRKDAPFMLVIGWAAYGIAFEQFLVPTVAGAASAVSYLTQLLVLYVILRRVLAR